MKQKINEQKNRLLENYKPRKTPPEPSRGVFRHQIIPGSHLQYLLRHGQFVNSLCKHDFQGPKNIKGSVTDLLALDRELCSAK